MNDPAFKTAAYTMAETTPKHLGQPTLPPQSWYLEGANLVVLLADGRKVRGPIVDQKRENIEGRTSFPKGEVIWPTPHPAETEKPLPSSKPSPSPRKKK